MSLLESLLAGEDARVISIQDSTHSNGRLLLKCFLTCWVEKYSSVHLFLYDMEGHKWTNGLPHNVREKVILHCGYLEYGYKNPGPNLLKDFNAQKCVEAIGQAPLQETAVVVDCVSTLLLDHKLSHVARSLNLLGSTVATVLYLVHGDLHDSHVMAELNFVTSTRIIIKSQEPTDNLMGQKGSCSIVHCKKSGRVVKKDQLYEVTEGYRLSGREVDLTPIVATQHQNPAANLTFSVTLSSKERSDRANTALPYVKSQQASKGGQIHYQPDESDDIDHSDPDEDLDI